MYYVRRWGKVKFQTPKLDKKKQPRGRAHKRMQYKRRFLTAGMFLAFGRRGYPKYSSVK